MWKAEIAEKLIRVFVRGRLSPSIRTLSVEDFRRAALAMRDETIVVTCRDVARVLRSFLASRIHLADLVDWTTVIFYGVHPNVIMQVDWSAPRGVHLSHKGMNDPRGIAQIGVEYEEKCSDVIAEIMNDLEDLEVEGPEPSRENVSAWLQKLSECGDAE